MIDIFDEIYEAFHIDEDDSQTVRNIPQKSYQYKGISIIQDEYGYHIWENNGKTRKSFATDKEAEEYIDSLK